MDTPEVEHGQLAAAVFTVLSIRDGRATSVSNVRTRLRPPLIVFETRKSRKEGALPALLMIGFGG